MEFTSSSIRLHVKELREGSKKYGLKFRVWQSVRDVKQRLDEKLKMPFASQRLFFHGRELKNHHTLENLNDALLHLVMQRDRDKEVMLEPYGTSRLPTALAKVLEEVKAGMIGRGFVPTLAMEGSGGTYFLKNNSKQNVACFKPTDEEPFSENNPRGLVGRSGNGQTGLRDGVLAGEACEREVAAYVIDRHHFHGVPPTALVESAHAAYSYLDARTALTPKVGSFQAFVDHDDVAGDLSASKFPTAQVRDTLTTLITHSGLAHRA